ncbi:LuxR C-terminal-related transcriptional regulator [Streptomyces sp. CB03911]|uniref:LuxR C-terminal-related transcriptional regulator n=1 Tax=Streptomyces sp. CB03911 TaxID=1804758 RepID=UPI00093C10C6|nr:LuxR C-terminal-related transcriptional regulator [Streptomyces sp. CB03911]OKI16565.1 hypothetical protein A6A07_11190 [Streptomyces sp. CB03911]
MSLLTARQLQILTRVAEGDSNPQIAKRYDLALGTVATHLVKIRARLGARDRAHAVHLAHEAGLLGRKPRRPSAQQVSILALAGDGLSNAQIAEGLGLPVHVVKNSLHKTFLLLGVARRADAIDAARRAGLIPTPLRSAA